MNEWKTVLVPAKRSLVVLVLACVVGIGVVLGLRHSAGDFRNALLQMQAAVQEQQAQLEIRQSDLLNIHDNIARFEALRAQGLVGDPDRALWVEQLQASYKRLGLPGTVAVELSAARPLPGKDAANAQAVAANPPSAPPTGPMAHDLQFGVRDVLETEVLALIDDFRAQAKGRFRLNACKLHTPVGTGLSAQCQLRFISMPLEKPTPPTPPAP